jgi:predicted house-cleaning NTP pyrophosphatase (Maf/HAM1 superfamily)
MTTKLYTVRVIDLAVEPGAPRKALSPSELVACACCAKLCGKIHELNTGARVGRECASALEALEAHGFTPETIRFMQISKKQVAFYIRSTGRA